MAGHNFGEEKKIILPGNGKRVKAQKCQLCGAIRADNDPYFNMECSEATKRDREVVESAFKD